MRVTKLAAGISHSKICIVGGGSGGLNICSHLLTTLKSPQLRLFQPSHTHHYQSSYTMVGGNLTPATTATRPQRELFPQQLPITFQAVTKIDPENNRLTTDRGEVYTYEQLVLLAGVQLDWGRIKGAREAVQDEGCPVATTYTLEGAVKMNRLVGGFRGGRAVFTEPELPVKCGGAPQKILYLSMDRWRKLKNVEAQFNKTNDVIFPVPQYAQALTQIARQYKVDVKFKSKLVEVRKKDQVAVFQRGANLEQEKFDLLHLVPPIKPPKFIAESGLADSSGYADVDKYTLQHKKYPNIWAAGDCSNLPTSKTAAAIFSQSDILIQNLKDVMSGQPPSRKYDGYTCCPIFVGGKKLILAEFKYDNVAAQTFFKNQQIPRRSFYYLKKSFFPFTYWKLVPRGLWAGRDGFKTW